MRSSKLLKLIEEITNDFEDDLECVVAVSPQKRRPLVGISFEMDNEEEEHRLVFHFNK